MKPSATDAFDQNCAKCDDGWVCENHSDRGWPSVCDCGAGMPCTCNPLHNDNIAAELIGAAHNPDPLERIIKAVLERAAQECDPSSYQAHHASVRRRCQTAIRALPVADLARELAPMMGEVEWFAMETAPKDGTPILISGGTTWSDSGWGEEIPMRGVALAWWYSRSTTGWCLGNERGATLSGVKPACWMPLPKPPTLKGDPA